MAAGISNASLSICLVLGACCSSLVLASSINWVSVPTAELVVSLGGSVLLDCSAYGASTTKPLVTTWQRGHAEGADDANVTMPSLDAVGSRFPNGSLYIPEVDSSTPGLYLCTARNGDASQTAKSELRLAYLSEFVKSPSTVAGSSDNNSTSLECITGRALPTPQIYWLRDGHRTNIGRQTNATFGQYGFADSRQFTMRIELVVSELTAGEYRCEARNPLTGKTVVSQATTISLPDADQKPKFIQPMPKRVRVQEMMSLFLPCRADGSPTPVVSWYRNHDLLDSSLVLSNGSFYIRSTSRKDAGQYHCSATNKYGTADSPPTHVDISYMDQNFIQSPGDTTATAGQLAELICIPPKSEPTANISWYEDNRLLAKATNQTLRFSSVKLSDAGSYFCVAHNAFVLPPSRTSSSALFIVYASPKFIGSIQGSTVVSVGETISLKCHVTGNPPPSLVWIKDGRVLQQTGRAVLSFSDGNSSIYISNAAVDDSGTYLCRASNAYGEVHSAPVKMTVVSEPVIVKGPGNHTATVDDAVTLPCVYSAEPDPAIQWFKDGVLISDSPRLTSVDNNGLSIASVHVSDEGRYTCRVTVQHTGDQVSSQGYLRVVSPPVMESFVAPEFVDQGTELVIECVGGGKPAPTVIITHNDLSFRGAGEMTVNVNESSISHTGVWVCNVSNSLGVITEDRYITINYSPRFTAIQGSSAVNINTSLDLTCSSDALPAPAYTWTINNRNISETPDVDLATPDHLTIERVSAMHAGNYSCAAVNRLGSQTRTIHITVYDVPDPPANVTLFSPAANGIRVTWSLGVSANHKQILYYIVEYRKSGDAAFVQYGSRLSDSSTSLSLTDLTPARLYLVRVAAGNSLGTGPYSAIYSIRTLRAVPAAPEGLVVQEEESNAESLVLQWRFSADAHSRTVYELSYRQEGANESWHVVEVSAVDLKETTHTYTLGGLLPYTVYSVKVRAVTMSGTGEQVPGNFSDTVTVRTVAAAPANAPADVHISVLSSSSIQVTLSKPSHINGPLVGYMIRYRVAGEGSDWTHRQYNVTGDVVTMVIDQLSPWTRYEVQISVVNSVGSSSYGSVVRIRTAAAAPAPPAQFAVHDVTQCCVGVSWRPLTKAEWHSDPLLGEYVVEYWHSVKTHLSSIALRDVTASNLTIRGLAAWSTYSIRLRAASRPSPDDSSRALISAPTPVIFFRTKQQDPPAPTGLRSSSQSITSIALTWSAPEPFRGELTAYAIDVHEVNGPRERTLEVKGTLTSIIIVGLAPSNQYVISVKAVTTDSRSKPTYITATTMGYNHDVSLPTSSSTNGPSPVLTNYTTAILSEKSLLTKAELVVVIFLPTLTLFILLTILSLCFWCRRKRKQAEATRYFMNKLSSQTALTGRDGDVLSMQFDSTGSSSKTEGYNKLEDEAIDMYNLHQRETVESSSSADVPISSAYAGGDSSKSRRRRLEEDDLYVVTEAVIEVACDPNEYMSADEDSSMEPSASGFDNPNYASSDDSTDDDTEHIFMTSLQYSMTSAPSVLVTSADKPVFGMTPSEKFRKHNDPADQPRRVSVRDSRISEDIIEVIANQMSSSDVLANQVTAIDSLNSSNNKNTLVYSQRTVL